MSNGTAQPGENFQESKECIRRYSSFFVSTAMTGISCTICKNLTHTILSPTVDYFVNFGTSHPSLPSSTTFLTNVTASYFDPVLPEEINCSICPKNPTRKFHANGKHSKWPRTSLISRSFQNNQVSQEIHWGSKQHTQALVVILEEVTKTLSLCKLPV